jgi:RNA polymerase sigma-70 factor (ECF subfamily)
MRDSKERIAVERNEILARLRERIVRFAASRLSGDAAEDLAQEVLLVLHEKYPTLDRAEDLVPLSLEIARFKILGARRKIVRRGENTQVSVDDLPLASPGAGPLEQAERRQRLERLEAALLELGERCRELFRLKLEGSWAPTRSQQGDPNVTRDDIRKLIGGYATGTLTEAERKLLFEAALDDQELYEELAREQALKELLEAPGARARLIGALESGRNRPAGSWWTRPWPWLSAATVAAVAVLVVAFLRTPEEQLAKPEVTATLTQPADAPPASSAQNEPSDAARDSFRPRPAAPPPVARRDETRQRAAAERETPAADKATAPGETGAAKQARVAEETRPVEKDEAAAAPAPPPPATKQAAPQPPVPPPGQQTFGGFVAGTPAPVAGAARANLSAAPQRLAFAYDVSGSRLRITPRADGYLGATANVGVTLQVMTSGQRLVAGSTAELSIPAGTDSVLVTFSQAPGGGAGTPQPRGDLSGVVESTESSPNSPLLVLIRLR